MGGYLLSPSYVLPSSSTLVFLRSPFRATAHYPLSTVHYAWKRLVHSEPESFFQCRCKGSIDVSLGAFDILKAHIVKRHFFFSLFSVVLQRQVFGDLLFMMVFHRRSKRVKIFSERFLTKYLYKGDSNTSKRTCILIAGFQCHAIQNRSK